MVMIFCCGLYHEPFKTVFVAPDFNFRDRKLEILYCPRCGALVAELTQFNIKEQKYELYRPNRKKTSKFLKSIEAGKWQEIKVKYGVKGSAGFVYGVNREHKNGKIYQYAVDFNGEKRLVRTYG